MSNGACVAPILRQPCWRNKVSTPAACSDIQWYSAWIQTGLFTNKILNFYVHTNLLADQIMPEIFKFVVYWAHTNVWNLLFFGMWHLVFGWKVIVLKQDGASVFRVTEYSTLTLQTWRWRFLRNLSIYLPNNRAYTPKNAKLLSHYRGTLHRTYILDWILHHLRDECYSTTSHFDDNRLNTEVTACTPFFNTTAAFCPQYFFFERLLNNQWTFFFVVD